MKNTKLFALAAATVLSLGLGTAMAQESAGGFIGNNPGQPVQPYAHVYNGVTQPQAGSSDVERAPSYTPSPTSLGGDGSAG